jgi:hypothetical protein
VRQHPKDQRLNELEGDFRPLLVSRLQSCANGRWGLFGRNDSPEARRYLNWPEVEQLKEMASEIRDLRAEFGQPNPLVERLFYYCSLRGPNDPGEPKLARAFLDEMEPTE